MGVKADALVLNRVQQVISTATAVSSLIQSMLLPVWDVVLVTLACLQLHGLYSQTHTQEAYGDKATLSSSALSGYSCISRIPSYMVTLTHLHLFLLHHLFIVVKRIPSLIIASLRTARAKKLNPLRERVDDLPFDLELCVFSSALTVLLLLLTPTFVLLGVLCGIGSIGFALVHSLFGS
jgi:hypothetical protein